MYGNLDGIRRGRRRKEDVRGEETEENSKQKGGENKTKTGN